MKKDMKKIWMQGLLTGGRCRDRSADVRFGMGRFAKLGEHQPNFGFRTDLGAA